MPALFHLLHLLGFHGGVLLLLIGREYGVDLLVGRGFECLHLLHLVAWAGGGVVAEVQHALLAVGDDGLQLRFLVVGQRELLVP